jgi:hypothetical protein
MNNLKKRVLGAVAVGSITTLVFAGHSTLSAGEGRPTPVLLAAQRMYGVDGPFVGEANAIRGITGDELPWEIRAGRGHVDINGHLVVHVRGLVFADDPSVPPELVGKNDETEFRAALSCLSEDEAENAVVRNVFTAGFPATESGDADIITRIDVPNPCLAPMLFVLAGSEDKWFAVNGFEIEQD